MSSIPERITTDRASLALALKDLREHAFRTGSAAAHALGWSQPKISKIENGKVLPSVEDVERLLDACRAPTARRAHVLELAERLHSTVESNRTILRHGASRKQAQIAEVESAAVRLRYFAPSVVPGLLQTESYMRAMFSLDLRGGELERALAARSERQRALSDTGREFTFLVAEQALRWRFTDTATTAGQIEHVIALASRPNVTIGIVPISAVVRDVPLHGFEMFDDRLVTIGLEHAMITVTDPRDIAVYARMFTGLSDAARFDDRARSILTTALATLPRRANARPQTTALAARNSGLEVFPSMENTSGAETGHTAANAKTHRPRRDAMTAPQESVLGASVDLTKPSVARMYDYYLGGKDNFPVDREAAAQVMARVPSAAPALRANRACMERMVRYLTEQGVDQFVDLGTGLPTRGSVHEVAQHVAPDARVVYVDNDRTVLAHARAILGGRPGVAIVKGDIRNPAQILTAPATRRLIDFSRPVAVLFIAVLHFITDAEDPNGIVAAFRDATPPGSFAAITMATTDGGDPAERVAIEKIYTSATAPGIFRTREQILELFTGYELVDPGLTRIPDWRPDSEKARQHESDGRHWFYAGLGRKPV